MGTERIGGAAIVAVAAWATAACGGGQDADRRELRSEVEAASDGTSEDTSADSTGRLRSRYYERGDCVTWDSDPERYQVGTSVVPCGEPHRMQVAERIDSPGGDYPTDSEWEAFVEESCLPVAEEFLGGPLDPQGRFSPVVLRPLRESWARGDSLVWCGIGLAGEDLEPFSGDVREADQAVRYEPGTCVAHPPASEWTTVVDCTEPHQMEIAGQLDLGDRDTAPTDDELDAIVAECAGPVRGYLGVDPVPPWRASVLPVSPESWDAGTRVVHCFVGQFDADGRNVVVEEPAPR